MMLYQLHQPLKANAEWSSCSGVGLVASNSLRKANNRVQWDEKFVIYRKVIMVWEKWSGLFGSTTVPFACYLEPKTTHIGRSVVFFSVVTVVAANKKIVEVVDSYFEWVKPLRFNTLILGNPETYQAKDEWLKCLQDLQSDNYDTKGCLLVCCIKTQKSIYTRP
jgi:hypothetical protein